MANSEFCSFAGWIPLAQAALFSLYAARWEMYVQPLTWCLHCPAPSP